MLIAMSHLGKMVTWIPRKWITYLTAPPLQRVRLLKPSIANIIIIIIIIIISIIIVVVVIIIFIVIITCKRE